MTILQIAALVHLLFYCGFLLGYRGYLLYKRTGINPFKKKKQTGIEGIIQKTFALCLILLFVVVLNYVFIENNYPILFPLEFLESPIISHIGIFLSLGGLLVGFISQLQMGDSWRLGYNENEQTKIINHGLYKYSRNPIYLGYIISNIGFFMMMPNAVSLCFLILSYVAIHIKIRLEEKHLIKKNGEEYEQYLTRVRRWI